jgi:hypothetical protein
MTIIIVVGIFVIVMIIITDKVLVLNTKITPRY